MSMRLRPGRVRSAYAFIKAHQDQNPVRVVCRMLDCRSERLLCVV